MRPYSRLNELGPGENCSARYVSFSGTTSPATLFRGLNGLADSSYVAASRENSQRMCIESFLDGIP